MPTVFSKIVAALLVTTSSAVFIPPVYKQKNPLKVPELVQKGIPTSIPLHVKQGIPSLLDSLESHLSDDYPSSDLNERQIKTIINVFYYLLGSNENPEEQLQVVSNLPMVKSTFGGQQNDFLKALKFTFKNVQGIYSFWRYPSGLQVRARVVEEAIIKKLQGNQSKEEKSAIARKIKNINQELQKLHELKLKINHLIQTKEDQKKALLNLR